MLTNMDKAWTALLSGVLVAIAEAVLTGDKSPMEVVTDPNAWIVAFATAALVWLVPNKEV